MDKRKVALLERRVKELRSAIGETDSIDDNLAELLRIIHQPPWTTVADEIFTNGILEAMLANLGALQSLNRTLADGARAVGQGEQ